MEYDWTKFSKAVFIKAPKESVYRSWVNSSEILKWYVAESTLISKDGVTRKSGEDMQISDTYRWKWHQDHSVEGTVLDLVENEQIKFTFGKDQTRPNEEIIVNILLREQHQITELTLEQTNMADTAEGHLSWHLSCNLGWSFFLTNLKSYIEFGNDLREHDQEKAFKSRAISL